ncbi:MULTISPECIES: hypothetical protein [Pelosinus]|uniref:Uncharacterized protein n=1 Tax=Pelosinus fermentans B4 TaxID=1149862 RepID=I9LGT2_9FIRM|nr:MULTISPECIES: hypothetical protein [Pelosinus]EIW19581.1 hypothetical protein FB4_2764 [Pelosinus fermentans B4]EIW24686.1 hypothetical protein FA11_3077 [Pelosinus fermentans A11]OAM96034.1 hypothetical protein FR7_04056 [Pelosinus fermentans DSM 17108]SDR35602.1 hypothetical protein SAMN04515679_4224 [Pelosinus fermentans]
MYSARLAKGGANSWVVEFRHPLLRDRQGNIGKKVRRGLGIDREEAQKIVDEVNQILADENLWTLASKTLVKEKFTEKTNGIFFDQVDDESCSDPWKVRDDYISLPNQDSGYSRIMLLGTTGAGKTTVIRQLIGTDPDETSFPAISAGRTTTCNSEFVFRDSSNWRAVVTFIPRGRVRNLVEECLWEAFKRAVVGEDGKSIMKNLLIHPEQRFRLTYLFGQYKVPDKRGGQMGRIDEEIPDSAELMRDLDYLLSQIGQLAEDAKEAFTPNSENIDEAIDQLYSDWIREDTEILNDLVDYIMKKIYSRFEGIGGGQIQRDTTGWPIKWTFETPEKNMLMGYMRLFAGNDGRRFGQLLAPVVNGIRIEGPFKPRWWCEMGVPQIVLIDGEGIGHDSSITTSLPIELTNRFSEVDNIVLVDNASQPMLDIPKVIIKDIAIRGLYSKLSVVYTRFEQVEGSNLLDDDDRRDHVFASQDGAMDALHETYNINIRLTRMLREYLRKRTFFFSQTNELKAPSVELQGEVINFLDVCIKTGMNDGKSAMFSFPLYDFGRLVLVITQAESVFMNKWQSLLGLRPSQYPPQHWARIKALSNRLALWTGLTRYGDLDPASDLASCLIQGINEFISSPKKWSGEAPSDEVQQEIISKISALISIKLNKIAIKRIKDDNVGLWVAAFNYRGKGSTYQRANTIRNISEKAIPIPKISYETASADLLEELRLYIEEALREVRTEFGGGTLDEDEIN